MKCECGNRFSTLETKVRSNSPTLWRQILKTMDALLRRCGLNRQTGKYRHRT